MLFIYLFYRKDKISLTKHNMSKRKKGENETVNTNIEEV